MSEMQYRIHSDADLPLRMQGDLSYEVAFQLVCDWNDSHPVEAMAWLEKTEE